MKAIKALYFCTLAMQVYLMILLGLTVLKPSAKHQAQLHPKSAPPLAAAVQIKP